MNCRSRPSTIPIHGGEHANSLLLRGRLSTVLGRTSAASADLRLAESIILILGPGASDLFEGARGLRQLNRVRTAFGSTDADAGTDARPGTARPGGTGPAGDGDGSRTDAHDSSRNGRPETDAGDRLEDHGPPVPWTSISIVSKSSGESRPPVRPGAGAGDRPDDPWSSPRSGRGASALVASERDVLMHMDRFAGTEPFDVGLGAIPCS